MAGTLIPGFPFNVTAQIDDFKREVAILKRQNTQLETKRWWQKVAIDLLMQGANGYEKTIAGLQAQNNRLRQELKESQETVARLQEKVVSAEDKQRESESMVKTIQTEKECLRREKEEEGKKHQVAISSFENKIKEIQNDCEEMTQCAVSFYEMVLELESNKGEQLTQKNGLETVSIGTEISTKKWPDLITHPSVIVIIGRRGSGKTVLGFCILLSFAGTLKLFVFGFPGEKKDALLPGVDILERLEDAPEDSAVLIDEASLHFHSRRSQADESVEVSRLISLSRHRRLTLIFISQEGRQIDVNIISAANAFAVKEPAMAQVDFDRRELRGLIKNAATHFDGMPQEERKRFTYFHSKDTGVSGLVPVEPPFGWSDELSRAFAGVSCGPQQGKAGKFAVPAGMMPKKEKMRQARELRRQGYSYGEIARRLLISKQTAKNYNEK